MATKKTSKRATKSARRAGSELGGAPGSVAAWLTQKRCEWAVIEILTEYYPSEVWPPTRKDVARRILEKLLSMQPPNSAGKVRRDQSQE